MLNVKKRTDESKQPDVELSDAELRARVAELQRRFTPPPGLSSSRPRDVELTAGGRAVYVVAFVLFGAAVVVTMLLNGVHRRQAADREAFAERSTSVVAEVTRLWRTTDDSHQPRVAYRYEVGSGVYTGQAKIRLGAWRQLQTGSTVAIRYLSDDPARSRPESADVDAMPAFIPMFAGMVILIPPILLLVMINEQRRLLSEGRPAPALVIKVGTRRSPEGGSHRTIRYAFPLLSGSMATGKSDAKKNQAAGSVICIIYDPDRPRRSQLYPFAFVRPANLAR